MALNRQFFGNGRLLGRLLGAVLAMMVGMAATAQDNLVLRYDFTQVSGTQVSDVSGSNVTAKLVGAAKVEDMGKYRVLNLGNGSGYLDLTSAAGEVVKGLGSFSVSVFYRVDKAASLSGNGYFLWSFSTSTACTATAGAYSAYRLNAQRIATSTGGYNNEKGYSVDAPTAQDEWVHVAYTQSGTTGRLYVNGVLAQSITSMPTMSQTFKDGAPAYCWMGRAPFSGDNYLRQTLVYDFRVYNKAISAAEVATLAAEKEDLDEEFRYGTPGDFTKLETAVTSAETYLAGLDLTLYPAAALMEYQDAINVAKSLIREGRVNQDLINTYTSELTAAKTKFTKTKNFTFSTADILDTYDTERGFRHPGGLHTQADFDRVKQQLKEGNEKVTAAYNVLKNAAYSSASAATYPAEVIVRGGSGENYINAARGATIAYQNALRWKIDGTKANADHAVDVLMAWCNTTKAISGTSDQCLAKGLYGYQFAQAAELMRDYEGWSREDFRKFQRWMLDVWYPGCIGFLRGRNGTWENAGKWWQAPGHYWSNWGLCNALAVITIGVLCDDVFIYNQGMSFIKYDQVGTFKDPRTANPILNDGLTEFWGNLVVTTTESELETGAYGKLGQMNESGRDTGHSAMALGLAVDIAQQGWNQGDDLFAYMDHRIAAGIEYVAAQTQSVEGLPWTNYHYASSGYYYSDSRSNLMTGPALGAQMRPYWGTVIGHYEGVKGVKMPFSEVSYENMGIDGGGLGGTSGGYDHLGYSVLMNTRSPQLAPANQVPTELTPRLTYNGRTLKQSDLGGLTNTYQTTAYKSRALTPGTTVTLSPTLPDGTSDTGLWRWDTGETTREITITANESKMYRVTYTNANGVESEQCFAIAVLGDCQPSAIQQTITYKGTTTESSTATVEWGEEVTLSISDPAGFCDFLWENGQTTQSITIPHVTTSRDIQCYQVNQGGRKNLVTFHLEVYNIRPDIILNGTTLEDTLSVIVDQGTTVTLAPHSPILHTGGAWLWDNGSTERRLTLESMTTSAEHTVSYTIADDINSLTYQIYVKEKTARLLDVGNYRILHRASGRYLTLQDGAVVLAEEAQTDGKADPTQVWLISRASTARYDLISTADNTYLSNTGEMKSKTFTPHRIAFAQGTNYCIFSNTSTQYWVVDPDLTIRYAATTTLTDYPFELLPVDDETTAIQGLDADLPATTTGASTSSSPYYDLTGRLLDGKPTVSGLYIQNGKKYWKK